MDLGAPLFSCDIFLHFDSILIDVAFKNHRKEEKNVCLSYRFLQCLYEVSRHFVTFPEGVVERLFCDIYWVYVSVKSCLVIYGKNR